MKRCQHLEEQMCWVQRNTEQGSLQHLSIMFTKRGPPGVKKYHWWPPCRGPHWTGRLLELKLLELLLSFVYHPSFLPSEQAAGQ